MFFFFCCCFLNKHFVRFWFENIIFSDFGFLSTPTKNVLLRCVVEQPQRQPGRSNLCCHGNISHVRACEVFLSVCACICCILGEWQAQLFVVIWCMTRFTHAHTHTHAGQSTKQKALWERLGWHICVCVCLRMETVNMKCVCVCTLGRRGSPWHSRNKIRPSNTLNYKTSLWKKRKNVFNFH